MKIADSININFIKKYIVFTLVTFLILSMTSVESANGQSPCSISINHTLPVCYDTYFQLRVPSLSGYSYRWNTGDTTSVIDVKLTSPADFSVTATDVKTGLTCTSSPFHVSVSSKINIDFQQTKLTCSNPDLANGRTAQVKAIASGAYSSSDYQYLWQLPSENISPGNPSMAVGLSAHQYYTVKVIDPNGCSATKKYFTKAFANPLLKIIQQPDTVYVQNPHVKFSFINLPGDSVKVLNSVWELDGDANTYETPVLKYTFPSVGQYRVFLHAFNPQGCDTVYIHSVNVLPVKLFIPNVITPNGDGINDYFVIGIKGSDQPLNKYYEKTELIIFNRWGKILLDSKNYKNDWNGGGLPDGTYYYVLKCQGFKDKKVVYKGSLTIFAGN